MPAAPIEPIVAAPGARTALVHLWMRLLVFGAPILLIVCLPVYLIDPYGIFSGRSIVAAGIRVENGSRVDQVLLGIISFTRRPTPNILLGDSQMNHFKVGDIEAVTHDRYSNLSYGGGTLAESIATFWYAARVVKLERVYFGMSFYSFIDSSRDRVSAAVRIVDNPLAYFFSGDVLEAAWDDASEQFFHHSVSYQPAMGPSAFWRQQLTELERRKQTYSASLQTIGELRAIVNYCRTHGIEIHFLIPPQHEDVRIRIEELGMGNLYSSFKSAVFDLGPSIDCDVSNDFTRDAANFQDPYHTTPAAASVMAKNIWSGRHEWCGTRRPN
jgi:hypothetical protein